MASTPVELTLDKDEITLADLAEAVAAFSGYLEQLDIAQSPNGRRTLDFRVTSLSYNSPALISAVAEPRENAGDNSAAVLTLAIRGIREIGAGGGRPNHVPDEALEHLKRLAGFSTNGHAGVTVTAPTLRLVAPVTSAVAQQIDRVLSQGETIGSIEGQLDTISVHGRPFFTLYDAVTGRGVRCYFPQQRNADVIKALGQKVIAHGRLRRDPGGTPREMSDLDYFAELGHPEGSADDLPGIFAGLDVGAYLREIRG